MSSPIVGRQEASALAIKPSQKFEGHAKWVTGAIHLPDGQRMMTCSFDGSLRVWNLKSGKQMGEDWRDGKSGARTIAVSPDGKKVVNGSEDGGVRLWDIDTRKLIATWTGHTDVVYSVCWSRDGHRVVSGSRDGTDTTMFATAGYSESTPADQSHPIKIWDAKTGELVATLIGHESHSLCLAWSPDGKTLISGITKTP